MAEQSEQPRRARRGRADTAALAQLRARRDELDAEQVMRRKLEDAALERYVTAAGKVQAVYEAANRKVAELDRQAAGVREKAKEEAMAGEAEQAAALLQLHELGRSAEELSQLTGIAVKRIRAMVRGARPKPVGLTSPPAPPKPHPGGKPAGDVPTVPVEDAAMSS